MNGFKKIMSMFSAGAKRRNNDLDLAFHSNKTATVGRQVTETAFFESVSDDAMYEAIGRAAMTTQRAEAAAAITEWVSGGDAEFEALDGVVFGLAVADEDQTEMNMHEEEKYNAMLESAAEFAISLGARVGHVEMMLEGCDDSAEKVFVAVDEALDGANVDDLIAKFSVRQSMMMEAMEKVVRDGEIVMVNTAKKPKRRMTAAQKAALKKARQKANSASAKAARKKSMSKREKAGL